MGCAGGTLGGAGVAVGGAGEVASLKLSSVIDSFRSSTSSRSLASPPEEGGNVGSNAILPSASVTRYFSREWARVVAREAF